MATQEEIDAVAFYFIKDGGSVGPVEMSLAKSALEAAERVREGLSKPRARRLGHFVMTGDDVLIREDRPE